jgi:hypothetical protein
MEGMVIFVMLSLTALSVVAFAPKKQRATVRFASRSRKNR